MGAPLSTSPVPELPPADVWLRGTEAQAALIPFGDEAEMVASVVRGFLRPLPRHARLIDPRPLAHERDAWADSVIAPEDDRAAFLAQVIGLANVCPLGSDAPACGGGRPTGILRFSPAYSVGRDSARLYAQYTQQPGAVRSELEFLMVKTATGWHLAARRSLPPVPTASAVARAAAEGLLAADRALGEAAGNTDVVAALSGIFDDSVIVQVPGGFANGKAAAVAGLSANAENASSRVTWAPIRAGVSADGTHGFTFGYMTLVRPDSARVPLKYLAYWIRRDGRWKVLAYKRRPRPAGDVSLAVLPPALPLHPQPATRDSHASLATLAHAEQEFSDTAQVIGIGPAFERYGRVDAMNMGGPADTAFVVGNKAIARSVGAGYPQGRSPVYWSADYKRIVAPSGDLGVTFGYIRPHAPQPGQPPLFPFFTIWKRDPGGPWRYIAE